jgi:deoxyribonuclease-4
MLFFGTAGVPWNSRDRSTVSGIEALRSLNLECLEMEFVQRVSMGEETARSVKEKGFQLGIRLSVHAPYYINLNSHDLEKRKASRKRLLDAARVGYLCGATDIVFHPGFYQGDSLELTFQVIKQELLGIVEELEKNRIRVTLRAETTGKHNQFGSLEETIRLAQEVPNLKPCVDFSHLHARLQYHTEEDFLLDLERIEKMLGKEALEEMHIHVSGMNYTKNGEKNHLNLAESDFPYLFMLEALHKKRVSGRIICESPNLEEDAILLKSRWLDIANRVI